MKIMLKIVKAKFLKGIYKFLKEYLKLKYNSKSCLCIVEESEGKLYFSTGHTQGLCSAKNSKHIRRMVGENILMMHGIPMVEKDIPHVMLLLLPSAIKLLKRDTVTFIREWRGDSRVGRTIVIKYITPWKGEQHDRPDCVEEN